jgi:hypothetical protein
VSILNSKKIILYQKSKKGKNVEMIINYWLPVYPAFFIIEYFKIFPIVNSITSPLY